MIHFQLMRIRLEVTTQPAPAKLFVDGAGSAGIGIDPVGYRRGRNQKGAGAEKDGRSVSAHCAGAAPGH